MTWRIPYHVSLLLKISLNLNCNVEVIVIVARMALNRIFVFFNCMDRDNLPSRVCPEKFKLSFGDVKFYVENFLRRLYFLSAGRRINLI